MKFIIRPWPKLPEEPFESAEEAWFWFIRCQQKRLEGARLLHWRGKTTRPCDPDDIYRAVMFLKRAKRIQKSHLIVMGYFGLRNCPPDERDDTEKQAARLWNTAMEQLTIVLKSKKIVAHASK